MQVFLKVNKTVASHNMKVETQMKYYRTSKSWCRSLNQERIAQWSLMPFVVLFHFLINVCNLTSYPIIMEITLYDEISKPLHFLKQFGLSIEDSVFWTIKKFLKRTHLYQEACSAEWVPASERLLNNIFDVSFFCSIG